MKKRFIVTTAFILVLTTAVFYPAGLLQQQFGSSSICYAKTFDMEQDVFTTGGTVKRHIDISNPWTGAYLYENLTVVGSAKITDSFSMGKSMGSGISGTAPFFGSNTQNITGSGQEKIFNYFTESSYGFNKNEYSASADKVHSRFIPNKNPASDQGEVLGIHVFAPIDWNDFF